MVTILPITIPDIRNVLHTSILVPSLSNLGSQKSFDMSQTEGNTEVSKYLQTLSKEDAVLVEQFLKLEKTLFSRGIAVLGWIEVIRYYLRVIAKLPYQIVSVGSGNGFFERRIEMSYPEIADPIICVDPEPNKFMPAPEPLAHKAQYSTVQDMVKERSDLIGNCILILNWPNPNSTTYDYEAICILKPKYVLGIVENVSGIAGGEAFHVWYNFNVQNRGYIRHKNPNDLPPDVIKTFEEYPNPKDYVQLCVSEAKGTDSFGSLVVSAFLLANRKESEALDLSEIPSKTTLPPFAWGNKHDCTIQ